MCCTACEQIRQPVRSSCREWHCEQLCQAGASCQWRAGRLRTQRTKGTFTASLMGCSGRSSWYMKNNSVQLYSLRIAEEAAFCSYAIVLRLCIGTCSLFVSYRSQRLYRWCWTRRSWNDSEIWQAIGSSLSSFHMRTSLPRYDFTLQDDWRSGHCMQTCQHVSIQINTIGEGNCCKGCIDALHHGHNSDMHFDPGACDVNMQLHSHIVLNSTEVQLGITLLHLCSKCMYWMTTELFVILYKWMTMRNCRIDTLYTIWMDTKYIMHGICTCRCWSSRKPCPTCMMGECHKCWCVVNIMCMLALGSTSSFKCQDRDRSV